MADFSLVQRGAARDLYSPLTHIAKRAEYGPMKTAGHALCGFAAPEGWMDETQLTLAGVRVHERDTGGVDHASQGAGGYVRWGGTWMSLSLDFENCVLAVLSVCEGRNKAISRANLLEAVRRHEFEANERAVRQAVANLRKRGELIGSTGGVGGGYYRLMGMAEVREFFEHELRPRAMDLLETEKAMRVAAERQWPMQQMGLEM